MVPCPPKDSQSICSAFLICSHLFWGEKAHVSSNAVVMVEMKQNCILRVERGAQDCGSQPE